MRPEHGCSGKYTRDQSTDSSVTRFNEAGARMLRKMTVIIFSMPVIMRFNEAGARMLRKI